MSKVSVKTLTRANKVLKINESKLDRYILYYADELLREQDPDNPLLPHLTDTERSMLFRYEQVYNMLELGRTDSMIRSFLMKEHDIQERQARYIMEEARILFGMIGKADKEGRKQASINFYRMLAQICVKDKQFEQAAKINQMADKLEGLYDQEGIGLNPEDFRKPTQFTFINNMQVVNKDKRKNLDYDE